MEHRSSVDIVSMKFQYYPLNTFWFHQLYFPVVLVYIYCVLTALDTVPPDPVKGINTSQDNDIR